MSIYQTKQSLSLYVFLGFLILTHSDTFLNGINPSPTTLNASSSYTFNFFRTSPALPQTPIFQISFPSAYSLPPTLLCTSPTFTVSSCTATNNTLSIATSTTTLTVLSSPTFVFTVTPILNPTPANTYTPFTTRVLHPNTTLFETGLSSTSTTITPTTALCSASTTGSVFQFGTLTISYPLTFPATNLTITIPQHYPDDLTSTNVSPTFTVPVTATTNAETLLFTLPFTTPLIISLLLPPSTAGSPTFLSLQSTDPLHNIYDSCTVSITNPNPSTFNLLTVSPFLVHSTTPLTCTLTSKTPIQPTDSLQLLFDPTYDLTNLLLSTTVQGLGTYPLLKTNHSITLSAFTTSLLITTQLQFQLTGILTPPTTAPAPIQFTTLTQTNHIRDQQTIYPTISPGTLTATTTCLTYEIGQNTSCNFLITPSNPLPSPSSLSLTFPHSFSLPTTSYPCILTLQNSSSQTTCSYSNNTVSLPLLPFLLPTTISINLILSMPTLITTSTITISTLSNAFTVDTNTVSLSTTPRQLLPSESSFTSSSPLTSSPTTYLLSLSLPLPPPFVYTLLLTLPFDSQPARTLALTNATLNSFTNQLLNCTLTSTTITLLNLMTLPSLRPAQLTLSIYYLTTLYYYATLSIAPLAPSTISSLTATQSNFIVYHPATLLLTLTGTSNQDTLLFLNNTYPILTPTLTIPYTNLDHIGTITHTLYLYEQNLAYLKQTATLTLITNTPNTLQATYTQSNPYFLQASQYTLNLTLTTPNATTLLLTLPQNYSFLSATGILNCLFLTHSGNSLSFSLASTYLLLSFSAINPTNFLPFTLTTSSAQGDKDFLSLPILAPCSPPCRSCTTPSLCLTCYPPSTLQNTTCLTTCNPSFFPVLLGSFSVCNKCDPKCTLCTTLTNCSACTPPFYLLNYSCLTQCPPPYYPTPQICTPCATNCSNCTSTPLCTACLFPLLLRNGACLPSCPAATYSTGTQCLPCPFACDSCTTPDLCLICNSSTLLYANKCYTACPNGVFQRSTVCEECQPPCRSCFLSSTNCTDCLSPYSLLANICVPLCPPSYFQSTLTCLPCPTPCSLCTSLTLCLTCTPPSLLYHTTCVTQCPAATYSTPSQCFDCSSACTSCTDSSICLQCIPSHFLFNNTCLSACPDFYFIRNTQCIACPYPCLRCNQTGCLTCTPSFLLQLQQCVSVCTPPYHPNLNNIFCQPCQLPCLTCTLSTLCTSCLPPTLLHLTTCPQICPDGTYPNTPLCSPCPQLCRTCTLNNTLKCLTCQLQTYLYGYDCLNQCPSSTTITTPYCTDDNCTLTNCLTCSSFRCLLCVAIYTFDSTGTCTKLITATQFINSITNLPIAFPFLILTVLTLIATLILKAHYSKMSVILTLYATTGLWQILNLILWCTLTLLWNQSSLDIPLLSIRNAPLLLLLYHCTLNLLQLAQFYISILPTKEYYRWRMQDNLCPATTTLLLSTLLSHRLWYLSYCKLAHKEAFSAPNSQYKALCCVLSLAGSTANAVVAGYLTYQQPSLNFLFYTGVEVALLAATLIVLSLATLLHHQQTDVYHKGHQSDNVSVEPLNAVEEEQIHSDFGSSANVLLQHSPPIQHLQHILPSFLDDVHILPSFLDDVHILPSFLDDVHILPSFLDDVPTLQQYQQMQIIKEQQQSDRQDNQQLTQEEEKEESQGQQEMGIQLLRRYMKEEQPPQSILIGKIKRQMPQTVWEEEISELSNQSAKLSQFVDKLEQNQFGQLICQQRIHETLQCNVDDDEEHIGHLALDYQSYVIKQLPIEQQLPQGQQLVEMQQTAERLFAEQRKQELRKIQQLLARLKEQSQEEEQMRSKIQALKAEEKSIFKQQLQTQQQLMERKRMSIEDKISKLAAINQYTKQTAERYQYRLRKIKIEANQHQRRKIISNPLPEQTPQQQSVEIQIGLPIKKIAVKPNKRIRHLSAKQNQRYSFKAPEDKKIRNFDFQLGQHSELSSQFGVKKVQKQDNEQNIKNSSKVYNMNNERSIYQGAQPLAGEVEGRRIIPDYIANEEWAVEPEILDVLEEVEARATFYLQQAGTLQQDSVQMIELEQFQDDMNNVLVYEEEKATNEEFSDVPLRLPKARVNRSVIDLSPTRRVFK